MGGLPADDIVVAVFLEARMNSHCQTFENIVTSYLTWSGRFKYDPAHLFVSLKEIGIRGMRVQEKGKGCAQKRQENRTVG